MEAHLRAIVRLLARIVEQVPCYRLSCTMDPEAADTALAGLAEALEAERHEGQGCSPGELLNKRR